MECKIRTFRGLQQWGHAWFKGAQVAKQARIPGVTLWPQDPQGHKKCSLSASPRHRTWKLAETSESRCRFLLCIAKKGEPMRGYATTFLGWVGKRQKQGDPLSRERVLCAMGVRQSWSLKLPCVPEIEGLGHRQGEHRVLMETGETRVMIALP